jgi:hypothetical protein
MILAMEGLGRRRVSVKRGAPAISNMIDKTMENDGGVEGKKKRTFPVNDVKQLEKAVGCNLDDLEEKKRSQMHANLAFQDFANPQLPLSLSMLKDRLKADRQDPMQSCNIMYQSWGEALPDFSKMQQWRPNFKDVCPAGGTFHDVMQSRVLDGSSSPSECTEKEENQLSDNEFSLRQSNKPIVLPKKKRKYIE